MLTRRERNAVFVLLFVIALCIALPYFLPPPQPAGIYLDAANRQLAGHTGPPPTDNTLPTTATEAEYTLPDKPAKRFPFDPNTLDEPGWLALGLPARNVRTILHYRAKGGRFRRPEDLQKIYGLSPALAEQLIPYVRIATVADQTGEARPEPDNRLPYPAKPAVVVDVNTATVEEWKALRGIGDVLASRIVRFRDKMGGFRSIDQVAKTYGLSDSVFRSIRPQLVMQATPVVHRININTAAAWDMYRNGLVDKQVAKAIVVYREQHGPYRSVAGIRNIPFITDSLYKTLEPLFTAE